MANVVGSAVRSIWWLVLVRGILLVLLGVFTLWQPFAAVVAFVVVFGIYAIADGATLIVAAIASRKQYSDWGWLIVQGVLTIIAGILIVALPGVAGLVGIFGLLWFLVVSTIAGGIMTLMVAGRQTGSARVWAIVGGILDIVFGILIGLMAFLAPGDTAAALVWVVAVAAIVFGVILVVTAFQVRRGVVTVADRIDEALDAQA